MQDLDFYDDILVNIEGARGAPGEKKPALKVIGMPGKHVPPGPGGVVGKVNDLVAAVSLPFRYPLERKRPSSTKFLESLSRAMLMTNQGTTNKWMDARAGI